LQRSPGADELKAEGFDAVVVATGVVPRVPALELVKKSASASEL